MTTSTEYLGLTLDDEDEFYDIEKVNANMRKIDAGYKEVDEKADGNLEEINGLKNPEFTEAQELSAIESGESISTIFGKLKKLTGAMLIGAGSTLLGQNLTAARALVSDVNGKIGASTITVAELQHLAGVSKNIQTQFGELNENMDGLKHGTALVVTDGMTDDQIEEWIRSKLVTGIRRIKIYNDKTFYKFGKHGNFNIWFFGAVLTEMTGIAIDHWTNKVYTIRIGYPDGEIYVDCLVNIKTAMIDISRYTWTSGSEMITRIGNTAHINLGLLNVTCNKDDVILTIPEGFRPQRWTTVYMYVKNESEEFMIRTASISNGSLLADVNLINAYILINASWTV